MIVNKPKAMYHRLATCADVGYVASRHQFGGRAMGNSYCGRKGQMRGHSRTPEERASRALGLLIFGLILFTPILLPLLLMEAFIVLKTGEMQLHTLFRIIAGLAGAVCYIAAWYMFLSLAPRTAAAIVGAMLYGVPVGVFVLLDRRTPIKGSVKAGISSPSLDDARGPPQTTSAS